MMIMDSGVDERYQHTPHPYKAIGRTMQHRHSRPSSVRRRWRVRLLQVSCIVGAMLVVISPSLVESTLSNNWYKRYPAYPPFCSTPAEMKKRSIPLLADDTKLGATRLVQVTAIIRHGARTPVSMCWIGASGVEEATTSPWNCDLTTLVATPSPNEISLDEGTASKNPDLLPLSILEKRYDALLYPENGLSNTLNGTCQYGQLILQGYDQEMTNGVNLRNAYLYDGNTYDHDERMRLIDLSSKDQVPFAEPAIRYRSDDDQRTVMSGQILLQGMFGPELTKSAKANGRPPTIPVHLADRNRDIMDPNTQINPRLGELWGEVEASDEYKMFDQSSEAQRLRTYMKDNLGTIMEGEAIDCLMTTICTDRPLPAAFDDYGHERNQTRKLAVGDDENSTVAETNVFQRIVDFYIGRYALHIRYNNSEPAKLGMGPLWAEIMDNINPIVDPNTKNDRNPPPAKFALFSGHDDTIMPLLASLGPNVWDNTEWPPYASMVILEIHEIIDGRTDRSVFKSSFAFRLLYNGKILTSRMEGCPSDSDLCDVQILRDQVKSFATRTGNHARQNSDTVTTPPIEQQTGPPPSMSVMHGLWLIPFVSVLSGIVGSVVTFICLKGRLPVRTLLPSDIDEDLGLSASSSVNGNRRRRHNHHQALYSDEPESLFGHETHGKASNFEAAAIEATLA